MLMYFFFIVLYSSLACSICPLMYLLFFSQVRMKVVSLNFAHKMMIFSHFLTVRHINSVIRLLLCIEKPLKPRIPHHVGSGKSWIGASLV